MFIKVRFVDMLGVVDVGWLGGEKAQLLKVTGLLVVMLLKPPALCIQAGLFSMFVPYLR